MRDILLKCSLRFSNPHKFPNQQWRVEDEKEFTMETKELIVKVVTVKGDKENKVKAVKADKKGTVKLYTEAEIAALTKAGLHKDHAAHLNDWLETSAKRLLRGGDKAATRAQIQAVAKAFKSDPALVAKAAKAIGI